MNPPRHFLDLDQVSAGDLRQVLDRAVALKATRAADRLAPTKPLTGRTLAMIFDKPSTHTRVSFDVAMRQLGGEAIMLTGQEMQLGRGESLADTAKVLSRFVDAIVVRILSRDDLLEIAGNATVPVINGLTKASHPCQIMADVLTFEEQRGPIVGRTVAWTGDANNVLASWNPRGAAFRLSACHRHPGELAPPPALVHWARSNGADIILANDPLEAVRSADAVVTDCWVSMGDEDQTFRNALLAPYRVTEELMAHAHPDAIFMHCLPAHRGEEVTERRDGRSAFRRVRRSGKPSSCAKGHPVVVPRAHIVTDAPSRTVSDQGFDDTLLPFAVEPLDVRGRLVRLGPAIDTILKRHAYPAAVARLLGEAAALTCLLGAALDKAGRFQLQTRSDGLVDMLVVDFDAPDRLRAFARFDADRLAEAEREGHADTASLLGKGHLAFTIDTGPDAARYQGVVALDGDTLESAAHHYFRQSEQIPTLVRLAVGQTVDSGGTHWRAGGLIVQFLPDSPERRRQADLHPGNAPEGTPSPGDAIDDAWEEARALAGTAEDHELVDPMLSGERLLYRLFHERGVTVFGASVGA